MLQNQRDNERIKLFNRRALFLGGLKLTLFGALASRLYYLQVVEADRYAMMAEENRISMRLLAPPRGRIIDHVGEPLAINSQNYRVVISPEQTADIEGTLSGLSTILSIGERDRRRVLRDVRRRRSFVPILVRDNLTWEEVTKIEVNAPDLPGVSIEVGLSRAYPHGAIAGHLLGYVAPPAEADLTGDPLLELPDFRVGRNGVEKTQDAALRGAAGASQVEVNALGRVIRELSREEAEGGREIKLTLDMGLQKFTYQRLGEESAAVVVLDCWTGAVLAIASAPSYDPNAFTRGLTQKEWEELTQNPRVPLSNKAIAGQYAPGSTFKMIVALAALESGLMPPAQSVYCPGFMELGDARFHCWKKHGHGAMAMIDGIQHSCDVYFYEVAKRIGIDRIAAMARRFGLGEPLGIDVPGERGGLVPTRAWKQATVGVPWQQGENLVLGIGQGYLLTTPLQLATMAARLGTGLAIKPYVVAEVDGQPPPAVTAEPLGLDPRHLALVQRGMYLVVNDGRGTAYKSRILDPAHAMAGKTGSVQIRRITQAERDRGLKKQDELAWKDRDHAMFVAYAPIERPRYAIGVVVEHGGGGSSTAAPIARDVLAEAQKRDVLGIGRGRPLAAANPPPGRS